MTEIINILTALAMGGGAGFSVCKIILESEARKALKPDLELLHERIGKIRDEFVTCKFCTLQHDTLATTLKSMDSKLDILISKED